MRFFYPLALHPSSATLISPGNPAFEEWLRENPDHQLAAIDFPAKVEVEAKRVKLPCAFKTVQAFELPWGTTPPVFIDTSDTNTPEDLKANLYHSIILDKCGAATLTISDFEGTSDAQLDGFEESAYLSRRLFLTLCEEPDFAIIVAKMMYFVLELLSNQCGTRDI